jgi:hypothetical protein
MKLFRSRSMAMLGLLVLACGGGKDTDCFPVPDGVVTATLSSVTLAQDCGASKAAAPAESDFVAGMCAEGYDCASLCRQSSMQLAFGNTGPNAARIEIKEVRLLDINTRAVLERLSHREPTQWKVDQYISWDEKLVPGELKASYKLSAPSYSYSGSARLAWDQKYIVEVDVAVDGTVRTLTIEATREPEVVT